MPVYFDLKCVGQYAKKYPKTYHLCFSALFSSPVLCPMPYSKSGNNERLSGATDVDSSTAPKHIRILVSLDGKVESRSMHFMYTCIGLRNAHQPNVSPRTSQVQQPNAVRGQGRKTWLRRLSLVSYVGCAHSLLRFIICKSSEERITRNTT